MKEKPGIIGCRRKELQLELKKLRKFGKFIGPE